MVSPHDTHLGGLGGRRRAAHALPRTHESTQRAGRGRWSDSGVYAVLNAHPPSGARIGIVADQGGKASGSATSAGVRLLLTFAERDAAAGGLPQLSRAKGWPFGQDKGAGESSQRQAGARSVRSTIREPPPPHNTQSLVVIAVAGLYYHNTLIPVYTCLTLPMNGPRTRSLPPSLSSRTR